MKIITLTLNPAFDVHCFCGHFEPFHENLASITSKDAGGKGVNISRALTENGVANTALVVFGEQNALDFRHNLDEYGIEVEQIVVPGRIRENITIHTSDSPETRISFAGFDTDDSLLERVMDVLASKIDANTVITFTGRLPTGISVDAAKRMLLAMRERGAKIVIDSRSFSLNDIIDCRPWLIKPNDEEIAMYSDSAVHDLEDAARAAQALREQGIENVMISLGAQGAVLSCEDGCFSVNAPSVEVLSTIGAGDSSIAGFLAAAEQGCSPAQMLKRAVCYGSAACQTEGTQPPKRDAVKHLMDQVTVQKI